ncbi:MAG TPA: hypothetical protein PLX80_12440 [Ignavibacteria bacterium]|nr:hypothetical protein [Ignavibacteria bacterium]
MKTLSCFIIALTFFIFSENSYSQSWLPKPVESVYADALTGTWTSEPYEFMGNTNTDVVTCSKILNSQYLEIDFKRTDNTGFTYEGKEIVSVSPDGNMNGMYYDIMGKEKALSYTGSKDGDKLILMGISPVGKGSREIIIDGNTMTHNVKFVMSDDADSSAPEQNIKIIYNKTN